MFRELRSIDGKSFAFFFCHDPEAGAFIFDGLDRFYDLLRQQGARVVGSPEWHKRNATITDCYAVTTVNGGSIDYVGGFVGLCKGGNTVTNCYEACSVSGTATNIGAFIGYIDTAGSTVSKCIAWEAALPFVGGVKTAGQDSNVTDNYIGTEGTVSAKAQSMGWSADIWDFSGDFPKLK